MRITRNMMMSTIVDSINDVQTKLFKNQRQIAESRRILFPSDDPVGTNRVLINRTALAKNEQYQANVTQALNWLETNESMLDQISSLLTDAEILANKGATDTYGNNERHVFATEISNHLEDLLNFAQTTFQGKYIFGGQQTLTSPFTAGYEVENESFSALSSSNVELDHVHIKENTVVVTDSTSGVTFTERTDYTIDYENGTIIMLDSGAMVNGQNYSISYETDSISSITPNTEGISGDISFQIGHDVTMKVNVEGDELFTGTINLFDTLISLRNKLERDDIDGVKELVDQIKSGQKDVLEIAGELGSKMNRLSITNQYLENENSNLQTIKSKEEDLNLAEALLNLQVLETAYQAALTANSEIIKMNLLNLLNI